MHKDEENRWPSSYVHEVGMGSRPEPPRLPGDDEEHKWRSVTVVSASGGVLAEVIEDRGALAEVLEERGVEVKRIVEIDPQSVQVFLSVDEDVEQVTIAIIAEIEGVQVIENT